MGREGMFFYERPRTGRETKKRLRTWSALPSHSTPTVGHVEQSSSYARYAPLEHCKQLPRALSGKLPNILHIAHSDELTGAYLDGGHAAHVSKVELAWRCRPTLQVKQAP